MDYVCENKEYLILRGKNEIQKVQKTHKKIIYHKILEERGLSLEMMNHTLALL